MKISLYFTQYISQNQYISKNTLYECKNLRENSLPHAFRSVNHESFSMSCQSFVFTSAPAKCVHDCWSEKPTLCNPFFFETPIFFPTKSFLILFPENSQRCFTCPALLRSYPRREVSKSIRSKT